MKLETEKKIKYGVWGLVFGAVIAMIVGFGWGGWTTAGTSQKITEEAVVAKQASICVAQFMGESNHLETLKEFEKVSRWEKARFIEKAGWDIMPGQEKAGYGVAQACSDGLVLLMEKQI